MKIMSPMKVAAQAVGRMWMACVKAGRKIENGAAATLIRESRREVIKAGRPNTWPLPNQTG